MVQSVALAASAVLSFASLSLAAPSDYGHEYLYGFPVCKHEVTKPAYDKNGYGYGWENGKSCIVKKKGYEQPKYEQPKYEQPKYEQPKYETPTYQTPTYQTPTYQTPTYQTPTYQTPTYQTPTYQPPAYETPAYQTPAYQAPAPSYAPKAAFAPQALSYAPPQCSEKYFDGTYKDCAETFEYVKAYYCPPPGSTAAGDCITKVASVFDKCIAGIDAGVGYCWDESFFVKYSGYAAPSYYEAPAQKQYFARPAANSYAEKYEYLHGFPVCKHEVKKPAYDKNGYGYGWENGKSCILKKDDGYKPKYEAPKYEQPKYEAPKYEQPKYEQPKYEQPKYEQPKYEQPKYEAPKYEQPSYQPSYQQPSYTPAPSYAAPKQYFAPSANSYAEKYEYLHGFPVCKYEVKKPAYDKNGYGYGWENGKSCILKKGYGYEAPKYEAPKYEPKYEAPKYEAPKYEAPKYEAPKYEYQQPSYSYQPPRYGY